MTPATSLGVVMRTACMCIGGKGFIPAPNMDPADIPAVPTQENTGMYNNMEVNTMVNKHFEWPHLDGTCPRASQLGLANHQNKNLTIIPSQYNTRDGSLNDILLPSQDDMPLESNLASLFTAQHHQISQLNKAIQIVDVNDQFAATEFYMDHDAVFKEQKPIAAPPLTVPPTISVRTGRPPLRKGTPSYREAHIRSERQRRQDMSSLFDRLRSLLPSVQHSGLEGDRSTILGHVIEYVRELDNKVQELGKVKAQLMMKRKREDMTSQVQAGVEDCTTNVSVRFSGDMDIFITLNCPKQRGLWSNLLALLQDNLQLDVQNVAVCSTPIFNVYSIYAKVADKENPRLRCKMLDKTLGNFVAHHVHNNITP